MKTQFLLGIAFAVVLVLGAKEIQSTRQARRILLAQTMALEFESVILDCTSEKKALETQILMVKRNITTTTNQLEQVSQSAKNLSNPLNADKYLECVKNRQNVTGKIAQVEAALVALDTEEETVKTNIAALRVVKESKVDEKETLLKKILKSKLEMKKLVLMHKMEEEELISTCDDLQKNHELATQAIQEEQVKIALLTSWIAADNAEHAKLSASLRKFEQEETEYEKIYIAMKSSNVRNSLEKK